MTTDAAQAAFPITHDAAARRFAAAAPDGRVAGYLTYDRVDSRAAGHKGSMVTTHTVVQPEFGGQGIASELAREALGYAREQKLVVIPECSFVRKFIERHEEFQDLLP